MLFAIMGLLLGATPIHSNDLSRVLKKWLRIGIILVASLTVLISLYALSATIYRTIEGGWTINRLTIIGWNFINISILSWMIFTQIKIESDKWIESMQSVFSLATTAYLVWGLMLIIFVPILFR
jgi:multisubunit Na+/H+ antiporter MnhF subunit